VTESVTGPAPGALTEWNNVRGDAAVGVWETSPLKMSGAEFELHEAMLALRRVIESGVIRPDTRLILERAMRALEREQQ
jgi:hypothetical protein